ncbi:MAG TPA: metallophosphoesterase family protein [Roseiflexaceae bacterium]|nr:metallophosphoesterase family protein [Roseiflexaceae bacterium]
MKLYTCDRFLPPDLPAECVAARIGLISDTHMPDRCPALPPTLFEVLLGVDALLHAGDVGELWVLDRLSAIAPVIAVHGNDDTADAQRELPYQQVLAVAGQRIVLTHAHYPDRARELESRKDDRWAPKLERRVAFGDRAGASVVIFGHTHVPMSLQCGDVLLVNPGAIAAPNYVTRQRVQSVALLFIRDDGVPAVVHLDLAAPAQSFVPRIDWPAGFAAAHSQFTESIMAPDLEIIWKELHHVGQSLDEDVRAELRAGMRRILERCWSGQQALISRADVLAEARAARLPDEMRVRIESMMTS